MPHMLISEEKIQKLKMWQLNAGLVLMEAYIGFTSLQQNMVSLWHYSSYI